MGARTGTFEIAPFAPPAGDSLAAEHAAIARWIDEAVAALGEHRWYQDVPLKSLASGQVLLDADAEQSRRYVLAALARVDHFDREAERVRTQAKSDLERANAHHLPGWNVVWARRRKAEAVIAALMRRTLPWEESDLVALVEWCNGADRLSSYHYPLGLIVRAVERHAEKHGIGPDLESALRRFGQRVRESYEKDVKRLGTAVEQLCAATTASSESQAAEPAAPTPAGRPVQRAPAGDPRVLDQLKRHLELVAQDDGDEPAVATEQIGPDHFVLRADSPLRAEHALLGALFNEVVGTRQYSNPAIMALKGGATIRAMDDAGRGRFLLAAAERSVAGQFASTDYDDPGGWQSRYAAAATVGQVAQLNVALDRAGVADFVLFVASRVASHEWRMYAPAVERFVAQLEQASGESPLTEGERYVLHLLRAALISGPPLGIEPAEVTRLTKVIGDGSTFLLVPGEAWSDALNDEVARLPAKARADWTALLTHCLTATAARPSPKWLKTGTALVKAIGVAPVAAALSRWLPLVSRGRTIYRIGAYYGDVRSSGDVMHEENGTALRGLLWLIPTLKGHDLSRVVTAVAVSAYKKVPGVGPRAVKVGNAAVYALSELASPETVGQLAMLKVRVKFGTAQKEIEKAFNTAAAALNLPRDQIEELGVPSYGLEDVGHRRETFGDVVADLRVDGRDVTLAWSRVTDGKALKSVPAKTKAEHKDELKDLQQAAKDIAAMLPAQAERIDSLFLAQKSWPLAEWRARYLDHPLIGTLARRLIWNVGDRAGAWLDGQLVDVDDEPLTIADDATMTLWHPIDRPMDDVLAWRAWLVRHQVRQPFKQAHREIYVLTDAERRTQTYSNRFAAHVLRQHQFNALCAARGWKNTLRLMVDDSFPPASRVLRQWGLRAEYWVEGIGEDYGTDTNETGVFLRVATDQVRFYRTTAAENLAHAGGGGYGSRAVDAGQGNINEPLPLERIPPLVFSEILRDVDLFVGVASVGNDPTWQDGGPGGRYATYWANYSFGELGETAKTRRAVLESLLPRLTKLKDRWRLDERFLVVRGELRSYRIHLGSGNILMEPNDQYLCIVPGRSTEPMSDVFLPFEGDQTLSIILSKAFLLAADTKITDPTITRQLKRV